MKEIINNKKNDKLEKSKLSKIFEKYKKFYNENLKKKQIVIFVIMVVIFISMLSSFMGVSETMKSELFSDEFIVKSFFEQLVKEKIPLLAVIIFAGITPFFFLSVIGILVSYTLAFEICRLYFIDGSIVFLVIGSFGSIIQIIAVSLCVATGIYYCIQSTKKFRYNQHMNFGLKDVKKAFYEIRKDEEKLSELIKKENNKAEEREKLNVKIPYTNLVISFLISTIILILGLIIVKII